MGPSAGSSCTEITGAAGESLTMGLKNRSCFTNCSLGVLPAVWGTRYSRYSNHSCYFKKQVQEACDG